MHLLNGSYTGYFNVRHRHVGHLLQGRFKAAPMALGLYRVFMNSRMWFMDPKAKKIVCEASL